ncbi:Chaperone protein dnaJ 11, chloroplastic [Linum perenne]
MIMASPSLYEVLGIQATASGGEIKAAYRRLVRTCHTNVVSVRQKQDTVSSGEDVFKKINSAYSTLSDLEDDVKEVAAATERR